jgi:hypothetical protein
LTIATIADYVPRVRPGSNDVVERIICERQRFGEVDPREISAKEGNCDPEADDRENEKVGPGGDVFVQFLSALGDVPEACKAEIDCPADGTEDAPSGNEWCDERDEPHAEVGVSELVDDLFGAGVVDSQDPLSRSAWVGELTNAGDGEACSDAPKRPPHCGDDQRVTASDSKVDGRRAEGQNESLKQNEKYVHDEIPS